MLEDIKKDIIESDISAHDLRIVLDILNNYVKTDEKYNPIKPLFDENLSRSC